MTPGSRGRSTSIWSTALLALLGWLVVAPDPSEASCTSHERPTVSLMTGTSGGIEKSGLARTEAPPAPKPCNGPMCSSRPSMPVSPAPTPVPRIGLWAILEVADAIASPEPTDLRHPDEGRAFPTGLASSIFHPPRLSSHPSR